MENEDKKEARVISKCTLCSRCMLCVQEAYQTRRHGTQPAVQHQWVAVHGSNTFIAVYT